MPEEPKHTPGPWEIGGAWQCKIHESATQKVICSLPLDDDLANAAFIVRACNNHDDLLIALRQLVNYNDADPNLYDGDDDNTLGLIMGRARHALLKASRGE